MSHTINIDDLTSDFKEEITEENHPLAELLKNAQINTKDKIERVPALMSIIDGLNQIDIMTEGNISIIKGKAKARKSFAVAMLVGSYLSKVPYYRTFISKTQNVCLLFDTEQSRYHVQLAQKRIIQIGEENEIVNLDISALRKFKPSERLRLLEYGIYNTKNLGFVVIDGIRDLVSSINDEEAATMLTSKFKRIERLSRLAVPTEASS